MSERNYEAVRSKSLSKYYEPRYVIASTETGEILDDAQGYGYKTAKKAYAAYAYKTRDRSKDAAREKKHQAVYDFCRTHKGFVRMVEQYAFEIAKGSWDRRIRSMQLSSPGVSRARACTRKILGSHHGISCATGAKSRHRKEIFQDEIRRIIN